MTIREAEPPLRLEHPRAGVALLTLNRPAVRNALNLALRKALAEQVRRLDEDPAVRVIIISGGPSVFAAGADLGELVDASPLQVQQRRVERYWQALAQCRKPLIAAVNGLALGGGCELALHADLIVAGATARLGQPEVRLGIMPGAGGTQRLVRAVGKYQALRILLSGCLVSAGEALAMGLVSEVTAQPDALPRALELAGEIARLPALALEQIKEVVLTGADLPLEQALSLERKAFHLLFDTHDQKEGMRAFLDKREPEYQGR
ncbi:enoyl-CoA hydratase-related protein [Zestomonas carbonaria]|uniref:2,3-dehydroadipyl-CoA hydratase n=1 Tax=Zestomonas carbonaria TaxID=2762745 RepID=A0A7U7IBP4_9GAMM|nr:enoyl-CoA hydratase-related protein [Pseudomonas carbonaria]CAD5109152.1 2,3-dehydroadipyl-CoA hydratase [Pseudomonas carbonaria]